MKILKTAVVTSSANTGAYHYMPVSDIYHLTAANTSVVIYFNGKGGNAALDTMTITTGSAAQSVACADKLTALMYGNMSLGHAPVVDVDFSAGITTIAYAVV